jgi:two-component system sensor histidine kinase BaeS
MRTKLFIAFLAVIITALVSNLIFERLVIKDFEDYSMGMREDRLYWVLASVEGSRTDDGWDMEALTHVLRWGSIQGFDLKLLDMEGSAVLDSPAALEGVTPTMLRRIESLVVLYSARGEFEEYPLFVRGEEIGSLLVRELQSRGSYDEKEAVFKHRGRDFLLISFLIAGGGALFLAVVLSVFLTGPLKRMRLAAESVAGGDLTARVDYSSSDEVGRLIASFNRMVETLEREESLRMHLTQNVAHELRTPLQVMRSNLEAVADGVIKADEKTVSSLMAEVLRLTNLVEGIEDLTRAEASFLKPARHERIALRGFLEGVVHGMRPLFEEKGIALEVVAEERLEAELDLEKLETVLKNIISNALKHTEVGSVQVTASRAGEDGLAITVEDTGPGLTPEELEVVFKRFYRGKGSSGVGLGLSIARELVEVMGASLEVESEKGRGSVFRVVIPPC